MCFFQKTQNLCACLVDSSFAVIQKRFYMKKLYGKVVINDGDEKNYLSLVKITAVFKLAKQ